MPEPRDPRPDADTEQTGPELTDAHLDGPDAEGTDLAGLEFESAVPQKGNERDTPRPIRRAGSDDATPTAAKPVATASASDVPVVREVRTRRRSLRRRLVSTVVLIAALIGVGGAYSAIAQASGSQSTDSAEQIAQGRQLFEVACITCHGANLQGVTGRGPSLIGTGGAATYFQVATGRMPAVGQNSDERRHHVRYTQAQIDALVAYVQSIGGGPAVPDGDLRSMKSLGEGGELFRLNCASCHGAAGKGAPLSAGKIAPGLTDATDKEIWTALLSGPENMPVFGDNQLTPEQKRDLIGYIQSLKASKDPGGQGLDRIGPVSEGLVIWVAGIGAIVLIILWIGRKAGSSAA